MPRKRSNVAKPLVFWTTAEWRQVHDALLAKYPDRGLDEFGLPGIAFGELRALIRDTMPEGRCRAVRDRRGFLQSLREKAGVFPASPAPEAPKDAAPAPDLQAEAEQPSAEEAQPVNESDPAPPPVQVKSKRISWKQDEWMTIARTMLENMPEEQAERYLRGNLGALTGGEVRRAQSALPLDRQRTAATLGAIQPSRVNLLPAFAAIAEERQLEEKRANEERARAGRVQLSKPEPEPVAIESDPWADMMEAMAQQFAVALAPMMQTALTQGMQRAMTQAMKNAPALVGPTLMPAPPVIPSPPPPAPPQPAPLAAPDAEVQAAIEQFKRDNPVPPAKPVRPHVGICGLEASNANELAKAYPQLRFSCFTENSNQAMQTLAQCDRIIAMTRLISHATTDRIKRMGRTYTQVVGGLTAVKHQIDVWMRVGELPTQQLPS